MLKAFELIRLSYNNRAALLVRGFRTLGPAKMIERPDWVELGMDRDIGVTELKAFAANTKADIEAGQHPAIIAWHTGLVPASMDPFAERHNDGEVPPPALGFMTDCYYHEGWVKSDWLITNAKAIEMIEAGLMPKWSPEFSPTAPYRIHAVASTQGGRAHFGRVVEDLRPENSESERPAELAAAEKKIHFRLDSKVAACAIVSPVSLAAQQNKESAMTEEQMKAILKASSDELKKDLAAETAKAINAQAASFDAKIADLKKELTANAGKAGETLSAADLDKRVTDAVKAGVAEAGRETRLKAWAKEVADAGSPTSAEKNLETLKSYKSDEMAEAHYQRLMAEAKLHRAKNGPAAKDGNGRAGDDATIADECKRRLAAGELVVPPNMKEAAYINAYVQTTKMAAGTLKAAELTA